MDRSWAPLLALILSLSTATVARAAVVEWSGTLELTIWNLPAVVSLGTGVATVNGSAGVAGHLNTLRLAGGLTRSPAILPLTDPENPTLISLRVTGLGLGTGTFDGISGGPPLGPQNTLPVAGHSKLCILFPGCGSYLPVVISHPHSKVGMGVGGKATLSNFEKGAGLKYSIDFAPWTIGVASIRNVTTETPNGGITTYTATLQGFVHGPASGTSNTATLSGVIRLVTPSRVETNLGSPDTFQAWSAQLTLRFAPEPEMLLLLGWGVGALLLLGRSRYRS